MKWLSILIRWVLLAAAVALTAWVMPDVALEGGVLAAIWVAALIAAANVLVQAVLLVLPRPGGVVLFAALTLAVNGLLVWLVSSLTSYFEVGGFLPAVGAAILISIFSIVLTEGVARLLPEGGTHRGARVA